MAKTIKVEYTIEPSWTTNHYTGIVEIDPADLEGLEGQAREHAIEGIVGDQVGNLCSWGWSEVT
jgi:hypothetical protein